MARLLLALDRAALCGDLIRTLSLSGSHVNAAEQSQFWQRLRTPAGVTPRRVFRGCLLHITRSAIDQLAQPDADWCRYRRIIEPRRARDAGRGRPRQPSRAVVRQVGAAPR